MRSLAASALAFTFIAYASSVTDLQADQLEHLLVDTSGYNDGGFAIGVTPCLNYISGSQNSGRTTAGQWMRVAFHYFATYNVHKGTGGIDGSIVYETHREENKGAAMNESTSYWAGFMDPYIAMSDMIALGTVISTSSCQGPQIPFKGGRKDAIQGGDWGVPEPHGSLHEHMERAEMFGFTEEELIELTACGHTVGSSHASGFPDVVSQDQITPSNTNGGQPFDFTKGIFDNGVATTFLDGTTTNPFVTSFNETNRSDLRIFTSDNNITISKLAQSNEYFHDVCKRVYGKMIDTVPAGMKLYNIVPQSVKPVDVHLTFDAMGNPQFTGTIRLLGSIFPPEQQRTVHVIYVGSDDKEVTVAATTSSMLTGGSVYLGTTTHYYAFSSLLGAAGVKSYVVKITQGGRTVVYDNNGAKYSITDDVQWVPNLSSASVDATNGSFSFKITAAVKIALNPQSVSMAVSVPTVQVGAMSPVIVTKTIPLVRNAALAYSGYMTYTLSQTINIANGIDVKSRDAILAAKATSFDIIATLQDGSQIKDQYRKLSEIGGVTGVNTTIWWVSTTK